jgi:hypothetical protein
MKPTICPGTGLARASLAPVQLAAYRSSLSILFSNIFFFNLIGFVGYGSLSFLFWADLLLLTALYLELLPALQEIRAVPVASQLAGADLANPQ